MGWRQVESKYDNFFIAVHRPRGLASPRLFLRRTHFAACDRRGGWFDAADRNAGAPASSAPRPTNFQCVAAVRRPHLHLVGMVVSPSRPRFAAPVAFILFLSLILMWGNL